MTGDNFVARLVQAKLTTKDDITDFDFDNKLKNLNKKLLQIQQNMVENELDELSQKVKLISPKGLTKDLINRYRILKVCYLQSGKIWVVVPQT